MSLPKLFHEEPSNRKDQYVIEPSFVISDVSGSSDPFDIFVFQNLRILEICPDPNSSASQMSNQRA